MNQKKYDSNFSNSYFDPSGMINDWAVDQKTITSWVNLNGANMIFVPVIDNDISHNHFFVLNVKNGLPFIIQQKISKGTLKFIYQN